MSSMVIHSFNHSPSQFSVQPSVLPFSLQADNRNTEAPGCRHNGFNETGGNAVTSRLRFYVNTAKPVLALGINLHLLDLQRSATHNSLALHCKQVHWQAVPGS